jgi:Mn2+/Fe2+ NRAMP family transporter
LQLLWAVTLGTLGCLVLQEIAARTVIASGLNLRQAAEMGLGKPGILMIGTTGIVVMLGCAAYEAGNILGAVSGLNILTGFEMGWLTLAVVLAVFAILWFNKRNLISGIMTFLVALMGIAFISLAIEQPYAPLELLRSAAVPHFPHGSALIVLGLVGTTIVPYNIFLGSGISHGKTIAEMRLGLAVSVLTGGFITGAIVVAGTAVDAFASFPELANQLHDEMGVVGTWALGVGLFAAGFSSSVTAPYAASLVAATLWGWDKAQKLRWVWGMVLMVGFLFGISGIKPIPVILTVQALNGFILPLLAAVLILLVNHKKVLQDAQLPGWFYLMAMLAVFFSVTIIGLNQIEKVFIAAGWTTGFGMLFLGGIAMSCTLLLGYFIWRARSSA